MSQYEGKSGRALSVQLSALHLRGYLIPSKIKRVLMHFEKLQN